MSSQEYEPIAGDSRVLYHCLGCGALVVNMGRHDSWHRELAAHSHHGLSMIGGTAPSGRVMPPGMPTIYG
ncbi:hypothetical protein [Mycobacterium malmoense]|uniref:hypothetical protein n=1 Tax=Mycobacterium malmoense TaxID=1780 RepID=UPI0011467940|nr:hypothetical protein [Mycobacterium malmoense]